MRIIIITIMLSLTGCGAAGGVGAGMLGRTLAVSSCETDPGYKNTLLNIDRKPGESYCDAALKPRCRSDENYTPQWYKEAKPYCARFTPDPDPVVHKAF